jgi:hypothetical protein
MVDRDALEGQQAWSQALPPASEARSLADEVSSKEDDIRRFNADASAAGCGSEPGQIVDRRDGRLGL